jgi:hypothetical protein
MMYFLKGHLFDIGCVAVAFFLKSLLYGHPTWHVALKVEEKREEDVQGAIRGV